MKGLRVLSVLTMAVLGGCGGQFIISAPDQVAPVGGTSAAVVRVRRTELAFLPLAVSGAALRLQIADAAPRGARSDKHGYAAALVPVPKQEGTYALTIRHQNTDGEEASASVPAYVWGSNARIIALDMDCLPEGGKEGQDAKLALSRLAGGAKLLYLTAKTDLNTDRLHQSLKARELPDGPILSWHLAGRFGKEITPLPRLKKAFPGLDTGVCGSPAGAGAFTQAGMKCILVGKAGTGSEKAAVRNSWAELASKGL